jgi:hypothetical protein
MPGALVKRNSYGRLRVAVSLMTSARSYLSRARKAYRRAAAPLGRRKLRRMFGDGLPAPFRRPLEFLFDPRLSPEERQAADGVEAIRRAVAGRTHPFEVFNRDG